MGATNQKDSKEDKISSSSVLNLSLCSINSIIDDSSSSNSSNKKDKKSKKYDNLESKEFLLEGKEEEIKLKYFTEDDNDIDCFKEGVIIKKRSKTFNHNLLKKAPKSHLKISNEYISPLKLNLKNFGNCPKWNKRSNKVLYDFQKNLIDCKSCNDEVDYFDLDDDFLLNSETERTTPNVEDLQNLLSCRKKMTNFRNSIHDRTVKEYENILNSDYIFIEDDKKKVNKHHHKKNNFWNKYIKQQKLKNINKRISPNLSRLSSDNCYKRSETVNNESTKEHGLFILGILECAANEKKGRNTVNV